MMTADVPARKNERQKLPYRANVSAISQLRCIARFTMVGQRSIVWTMARELSLKVLMAGVSGFLLYLLLFAGNLQGLPPGVIEPALRELNAVLHDAGTQWMAFVCLGIYFTGFLFFRWRSSYGFWKAANPDLWLASGLGMMAVLYAVHYVPSAQALTLFGGAVIGQGMAFWVAVENQNPKSKIDNWFGVMVVSILVIFLTWASLGTRAGARHTNIAARRVVRPLGQS